MLKFENVSFGYRRNMPVFSDLNLVYDEGVHLLLGPNGSGKTTLLHLAAGLRRPVTGDVDFNGEAPSDRRPSFLGSCFILEENFESPFVTPELLGCRMGSFYPGFSAEKLKANTAALSLSDRMPFRHMSLGMRRKANTAFALAVDADLLLLDEPANGMDIAARHSLRALMSREVRAGQTVIVATHTVADLETLYDTVTILTRDNRPYKFDVSLIAERLAFVNMPTVPFEALYSEPYGAGYRCIVPAGNVESAVDFDMLYCAMVSDCATPIINLLSR